MVYDQHWANNFKGFSKENPMDLKQFVNFFDTYIGNRSYHYEMSGNAEISNFHIRVESSQLPHLMALKHWQNLNVTQPEKQLQQMMNGSWTIETLKKADNASWQQFFRRIEGLPLIYNMLFYYNCEVKLVHKVLQSGYKNRHIDMIFYDSLDKYVYVLELRRLKGIPEVYVPTSFTVDNKKNARDLKLPHKKCNITNLTISKILDIYDKV